MASELYSVFYITMIDLVVTEIWPGHGFGKKETEKEERTQYVDTPYYVFWPAWLLPSSLMYENIIRMKIVYNELLFLPFCLTLAIYTISGPWPKPDTDSDNSLYLVSVNPQSTKSNNLRW